MSEKVKTIKSKISNGTYDWNNAVETLAEKAVIINSVYGSVWGINL